jgi:hypothetical protein
MLLEWVFDTLGVLRVGWITHHGNHRSQRADELVQALGTNVAAGLHESIVRGLRCTTPPAADLPSEIDGVHLDLRRDA